MRKKTTVIRHHYFSISSLFFTKKRVLVTLGMFSMFVIVLFRFLLGGRSFYNISSHLYRNIKPEIERATPDKFFELSNCKYCNTDFYGGIKNPILKVEMQHPNFINMMRERKSGINEALLGDGIWLKSSRIYHNATIKYDRTKKLDAKIKLIGMNPDQYGASSFYSFRVKMSGDNRIDHQKTFNILTPNSRGFIKDFLANLVYQKLCDGIRINYTPLDVIINKQYQGTYIREEFFTKYLIENNRYRESIIFESAYGKESGTEIFDQHTLNYINDKDQYSKMISDTLLAYFKNKNEEKLFPLFSYDKIIALLSISIINNSMHNLEFINNHWYYNPTLNKLEPILRELGVDKEISVLAQSLAPHNRYAYYKEFIKKSESVFIEYADYLDAHNIDYCKDIDETIYKSLVLYQTSLKSNDYIDFVKHLGIRNARYVGRVENALDTTFLIFNESFKNKPLIPHNKKDLKKIQLIKDVDITQTWTIKKEEELIIHKGCKVNFYNNANLIIYGKITVLGEKDKPIVFSAKNESHSSVFIGTDSTAYNSFNYTDFEKLSSLKEGFWKTSASITVYDSPISFDNCQFKENREGDDFINLFRVKNFIIKNCTFSNTISDAVDTDFSTGFIKNCYFSDIGNDAIDGSGSTINVSNSVISCTSDKAVSSGEDSNIFVSDTKIKNCAIGLVSKDYSRLHAKNVIFFNNALDLSVFQKKPEYGAALLDIDEWKGYSYLFQKESTIKVNGVKNNNFTFIKDVESKLYGKEYGKASK